MVCFYAKGRAALPVTGCLPYNTLLDFWAQFDPYEMNIALASNDVALDLLKMPEFQNPSAGFSFQQPHCVTMPFGPMLIRSNSVPQNTVIGIDKRFALEMGQVGDVTTEYDKLINRQFERTAITIISGFSKIYDEASRVLSTSLQLGPKIQQRIVSEDAPV